MSCIIFYILMHLGRIGPGFAAPVNTTALFQEKASPAWQPDPRGRGTWSLLYSCVFTLVLCIWNAIHLNVPPSNESFWVGLTRKIKWVIIALVAPEIVVFVAFQQWLTAVTFLWELRRIAGENPEKVAHIRHTQSKKPSKPRRHKWKTKEKPVFNLVYAYFVSMGGFVVDISRFHNTLDRVTITTNGMLLLASQGYFFHPSRHTIEDKSKVNLFAKILICVQVLWMVGQVLERKLANYPITLLEIHTIVHVVCALTMYVLWMRKPFDVQDPAWVPAEDFQEALAFMVAGSQWKQRSGFLLTSFGASKQDESQSIPSSDPTLLWFGSLKKQEWPLVGDVDESDYRERWNSETAGIDPSDEKRVYLDDLHSGDIDIDIDNVKTYLHTFSNRPGGVSQRYSSQKIVRKYVADTMEAISCTLVSGQALSSGLGPWVLWPGSRDYERGPMFRKKVVDSAPVTRMFFRFRGRRTFGIFSRSRKEPQSSILSLSSKDVHRLQLAGDFIGQQIRSSRKLDSIPTNVPFNPFSDINIQRYGSRLLTFREPNWTGIADLLSAFDYFEKLGLFLAGLLIAIVFICLPGAYGGVHYAATDIGFPTPIEHILWEISCFLLLAFSGLLPALFGIGLALGIPLMAVAFISIFIQELAERERGVIKETGADKKPKSLYRPENQHREETVDMNFHQQIIDQDAMADQVEINQGVIDQNGIGDQVVIDQKVIGQGNIGDEVVVDQEAIEAINQELTDQDNIDDQGTFQPETTKISHPSNSDECPKPRSLFGKFRHWTWEVLTNSLIGLLLIIGIVMWIAIIGFILAYAAARLYIVIEVFISLRSVSAGVYQTPKINFMNYVPHF